ncbi:ATPase [Novosphingobium aquiterrae]|uniref:ATPase n=1 Tax=Novosphingobium aquiterrae TaxID=624388 RepID=A0ABV6PHC4_9SPHN
MTGGSRIVAIDAGVPDGALVEPQQDSQDDTVLVAEDVWEEAPPPPRRSTIGIIAAVLAVSAIAGWSALFFIVNQAAMLAGGSAAEWLGWIRDWSMPVLLVGVAWLIAMRNSRREAQRFGETAQLLGAESAQLERRLTTVNSELSLAREFLASQARDLEALGRLATERLSLHSEQLSSLIHDNGARLDTIGTVSTAALDNMEKLRGQLPVIASAAKDVTNNIATAGRTAKGQLEEMVQGFNRLNQFGQASERQVAALREMVDTTLDEFTKRTDQLDAIATDRFAALGSRSEEFRTQLDADEVAVLAAIRTRAAALSEELAAVRTDLDSNEAESLSSLRSRLGAVRDESAAITRALRDGESAATEAWRAAIARLEDGLREAITKVGEIDERAMDSARLRLATLATEADELDSRMAERDTLFFAEVEKRSTDFDLRHETFAERLRERLAALDADIAARQQAQDAHAQRLAQQTATMADQLDQFAARMTEIAAHGSAAEAGLSTSLTTLAEKLAASRDALSGTGAEITELTDGSVRLLELIRASVEHSSSDLPAAIGVGEARLAALEERALALHSTVEQADSHGASLSAHVLKSADDLDSTIERVAKFNADIAASTRHHSDGLAELTGSLDAVRNQSVAVAALAQDQLAAAIEQLNTAARNAVAGIEEMSAKAVSDLAERLGEESGAAIDKAMRARAAEAAGQLEQAAAHAAGVSREAALQLRDQLAKVNELAGNLERRVAHARSRAEEQVDNDFARRVALINESLNSNAIDISRAMDSEVSDTAWAAYLKGDRGIFTRRAVKLLETPDAKAVAQLYEDDRSFRDNVSRYIHDFEAMLRQLLSTRDGHALGVTLLSSDMGKLYVALAQSIERLRN